MDSGRNKIKKENVRNQQHDEFLSNRSIALEWWNAMTLTNKFLSTIEWLNENNRDINERHPDHLTGREIQEIYELLIK